MQLSLFEHTNNTNGDVYSDVNVAGSLWEFIPLIRLMQTWWLPTLRPSKLTWAVSPLVGCCLL